MGVGRSKFPISYDEACRRAGDDVVNRLKETFEKYASNTGVLPRVTFLKDIFGDGMPSALAESLYDAFNGGQKGIKFSDLLRGLVLLIYGTNDEKISFLSHMFGEEGMIRKNELQKFLAAVDVDPSPVELDSLFREDTWVTSQEFGEWLKKNPKLSSVTTWLLEDSPEDEPILSFTAPPDPPTFYQTLAEKFNVEQQDVMDIEKAYWGLKGNSGKFDEAVLLSIMCPPLPEQLCKDIFRFLDINEDLFIDLSEMVRGISLLCRESKINRQKVCFELFDNDGDKLLNREELKQALEIMKTIQEDNMINENGVELEEEGNNTERDTTDNHLVCNIESILEQFEEKFENDEGIGIETFTNWCNSDSGCGLVDTLLQVLVEVCHVKMGLRPSSVEEECSIIRGYMVRFKKCGRRKGHIVNLICSSWFNAWRLAMGYEMKEYSLSSIEELVPAEFPAKLNNNNNNKPKGGVPKHTTVLESIEKKMTNPVPVGDPVDAELVEVTEEGNEGYTHVITDDDKGPSTASTVAPAPAHVTIINGRSVSGGGSLKEQRGLCPIDNTSMCLPDTSTGTKKLISLTNEGGYLRKGLTEYVDYYVLPNEVWKALVTWYGTTGFNTVSTLPRTVIDDEGNLELYPVMFKVFKHTTLPPSKQAKSSPWSAFLEVIGYIRNNDSGPTPGPALPGDSAQPVLPRRVLYYTASYDKTTTIQQMCESMQQVLHVKPEDLRIYKMNDEESIELLDDEDKSIEEHGFQDGETILLETRSKDNSWPEELIAVVKDLEKQEQDQEKQKEKNIKAQGTKVVCGATGLSNLGNTCFMNSALQCLSNAQPLKTYFIEKDHLDEINKTNPLGTKGVLAKRYGELVQDLWVGHHKSVTPLRFRFTIARHAPQFNNFQQQDAQELLSFVLDGIHEDLNRVKEKPYRELADSDDRPDHEVADEAWQYHHERNDSVVVDLLQGQLKSVVECSECSYKSVKFDPFTFLSLPLPMEQKVQLEVIVVRLDGSQPIKYGMKQEMEGKYHVVKEFLTEKTSIPYFMLVDVFGGIVRSFPLDHQKMRSVGLSGWLYAFEIPPVPRITPPTSRVLFSAPKSTNVSHGDGLEEENGEEMDQESTIEGDTATDKVEEHPNGADTDKQPTSEDLSNEENRENVEETGNELTPPINEDSEVTPTHATPTDATPSKESGDSCTDAAVLPVDDEVIPEIKEKQLDADEETNRISGAMTKTKNDNDTKKVPESPKKMYCSPDVHGFLFAVHRKTLRMENFFLSSQKNRPILFSVPMVVPCVPSTPRSELYNTIWLQVQRLIIQDPPNTDNNSSLSGDVSYPFELKMVRRDGLFCCKCPWYRFCRGCPIPCTPDPIGTDDPHYIAIDWNDSFLHLKYQGVLERPKEDESMDVLKTQDTEPIDLSQCFEAFSRAETLGEDEYWYCKKCQDHRPARKTLSIWRLPPILIVHLKRFQFHNGRWGKCQKVVNFPVHGLEPKAYDGVTAGARPLEDRTVDRQISVTPPINEENDIQPLEVSVEMNAEKINDKEAKSDKVDKEAESDKVDKEVESDKVDKEVESDEVDKEAESDKEEKEVESNEVDKEAESDNVDKEVESDNVDKEAEPAVNKEVESDKLDEKMESDKEAKSDGVDKEVEPAVNKEAESDGVDKDEPVTRDYTGDGEEVEEEEEMNITNTSSNGGEDDVYDLFAVTCHSGVLGGGHYTSFAKNPNNKWYYYNDSSCKETTESKVQNDTSAYMLFYELKGLDKKYREFRAKNHREGPIRPSLSPAADEEDFQENLRTGHSNNNTKVGRNPGGRNPSACRTQ